VAGITYALAACSREGSVDRNSRMSTTIYPSDLQLLDDSNDKFVNHHYTFDSSLFRSLLPPASRVLIALIELSPIGTPSDSLRSPWVTNIVYMVLR